MMHAGQDTRSNMFLLDFQKREMAEFLAAQAAAVSAETEQLARERRIATADAADALAAKAAEVAEAHRAATKAVEVQHRRVERFSPPHQHLSPPSSSPSSPQFASPKLSMTHKTSWTVGEPWLALRLC